jgi:rhodanese-related sulfurtransferase
MKKTKLIFLIFFISLATFYNGFSNEANTNKQPNFDPPNEFETLLSYLESQLSFIVEDTFPIIPADEVKQNLKNPKYHVIDIRSESWFDYGHIKGAKNLNAEDLLTYFENTINPADFEKIVLICYSGQSASYFAGLLRIAGYNNVYSLKWGMSSWRQDFAENAWLKNINNDFASKLETTENSKPDIVNQPELNTGQSDAKEILKARLRELFKIPYKDLIVTPSDVFENSSNYFVVNYTTKDNYDLGHITGALNYQPKTSLTSTTDLLTLPADKQIAIYDETGLKAAYMVAYLNVLGYKTGNIAYGANGFMNDHLKSQNMDAFTKKEINMFPVIE